MCILAKTMMNFALWCAAILCFCFVRCAVGYKKEHNLCHGAYIVYIEVSIRETRNYAPAV